MVAISWGDFFKISSFRFSDVKLLATIERKREREQRKNNNKKSYRKKSGEKWKGSSTTNHLLLLYLHPVGEPAVPFRLAGKHSDTLQRPIEQ